MTRTPELDAVAHSTVFDHAGEKVGKVEQVYIDDRNSLPTWIAVKTGWFGSSSLVPLAGAKHQGDRVDVATTKDKIKSAPHLDTADGISTQQGKELLDHYGLTETSSGWADYGKHTGPTQSDKTPATGSTSNDADGETLVRSEEQLNVGTEKVATGKARLRKYVVTEEQSVTVPVTHEEVRVVREPISSDAPVGDIGEAQTEVTLHEDQVVAEKKTVPVERVGLEVNEVTDKESVSDTVRKEKIETEGIESSGSNK
ncbi:hypothetical protein GOEFS_021_00170 [Gordonia effusa NBRC 100432]|uniref:DUF2382 domain-containing protein n=1 Tax=Gordonia effusa NBRC 100432 TaxID=1077974 RepID=H0QWI9_9ACTN|nr:PRC and DUF2382 domain-containing protein [Gordonia effusa]GAB17190.1 hypothetical protein GOEFS_021_00170 [Gordonia effusa NBRC 100432]